jgi:hypothetical protein
MQNDNPGPWSGLAMHPIEHVIYFSVVLIHFIVPSHPLHFFFNAQVGVRRDVSLDPYPVTHLGPCPVVHAAYL